MESSSSQLDPSNNPPVDLPDRNPQIVSLGFGKAKPVPLLVLHLKIDAEEFYVSEAAQNYLESLKGECYVISVSGNPLVGKSSLLNLLLSLFNMDASQEEILYLDMYTVGDGKRSTTEGIDMYCLSKDGKNFIFLDIEGDDDPNKKETGAWIYMNLLQTAIGVSHIHLYNYAGLPQKTFFNYFDSIHRMIKQNKLHPEFETKHFFLKRNDPVSKDTLVADLQDYKDYFEEILSQDNLNYSLDLLPIPPQHIIKKKSDASCIVSTGSICKECQNHLFTSILLDISHGINDNLSKMTPFKNGHHLSKILEQLLIINQKEIPRFSDRGYISRIRLDKFKKEQIRIQAGLLEVERYQAKNGLAKEIQKILKDHPNVANEQFGKDFSQTGISLEIKLSQVAYLIPELWMFIRQYLLDEKASILNEEEKKSLYEAYVAPFGKILKEVITSLKKYNDLVNFVYQNLMEIKTDLGDLIGYMINACKKLNMYSNSLGRNVGLLDLVVIGDDLIKVSKKQKKILKKSKEILNEKKIDGIEKVKSTEEELEKMKEFVTKLVNDLEKKRETLNKVCSDDGSENFNIIAKTSNAMDDKVNGINLSPEDRNQLIEKMHAAEKNLQKFKDCL